MKGGAASPFTDDEASCSLVERTAHDDGRSHLLVAKRYRSVKHRAFRNDATYRHRTGRSHADKYPAWRFGTDPLLELVGDGEVAAPRLVAARLSGAHAAVALEQVLGAAADMLALGWVHGDLSPFNVLWHHEQAVLIDFPQTMDLGTHPMALDVLHRDVSTMCEWARRRGAPPTDPDEAFARLLSVQFG